MYSSLRMDLVESMRLMSIVSASRSFFFASAFLEIYFLCEKTKKSFLFSHQDFTVSLINASEAILSTSRPYAFDSKQKFLTRKSPFWKLYLQTKV